MSATTVEIFGSQITYTPPATGGWEDALAWVSMFALSTVGIGAVIALATLGVLFLVSTICIRSWAYRLPINIGKWIQEYGLQFIGMMIAFMKYYIDEWVGSIDVATNKRTFLSIS